MENYCAQRLLPRAFVATVWFFEVLQFSFFMAGESISNEAQILLSLKNSLKDPLNNLQNWSVEGNNSVCTWTGVTCGNDSLSVVKLDLGSMGLLGGLSPDVTSLTSLQYLSLARNNLSGEIPSNIFNITGLLTLDLSSNSFTGKMPRGFRELQVLDLSDNFLIGEIPTDISNQSALLQLRLRGNNNLGGSIPLQLCTLPNLQNLSLASSALVGNIPDCLGNLSQLQWLYLGWNMLTGPIPASLGNLEKIFWLDLTSNSLTGSIPLELGRLSKLTNLYLYNNSLSGELPAQLGKLSRLTDFDVGQNKLTGRIADELGGLVNLKLFRAYQNSLTGSLPLWLGNLSNIYHIALFENSLSGTIPENLGRSSPLALLDLSTNYLSGAIPPELCHGGALFKLILFSNRLTGMLPESLGMCQSLTRLRLELNSLSGNIPHTLFALPLLNFATLSQNRFNGTIDFEPVKVSCLQTLNLSHNFLSGNLTPALGSLQALLRLFVSYNLLHGNIPQELGKLSYLSSLDLSHNAFSDGIPPSLSNCTTLVTLNLSRNSLSGNIPSELGTLPMLGALDLSENLLEGGIPPQLASSSTLEFIDLSYNNLSGPVPQSGIFLHLNELFLQGNPNLCEATNTKGFKVCTASDNGSQDGTRKHLGRIRTAWATAGCAIFATLILIVCGSYYFHKRYVGKKGHEQYFTDSWHIISFQKKFHIRLEDIQSCLDENNIIGKGSAGTVYRGALKDGQKIAVKRMWIYNNLGQQIGDPGFKAEMEILGNLRHRNIVKLLGCCFSQRENLLVFEYMPNGNLGDALHNQAIGREFLDWDTRFNIAIETAQGLHYLHEDCVPAVLHRDVKCHNILLDAELSARLADFGLAKVMNPDGKPETNSKVAGSHGYIAPEYAYTLKVDEKADIYSFGVIILELVTGRHPTDHIQFCEDMEMVRWLHTKVNMINFHDFAVEEIVDERLKPCAPSTAMEMKSATRIGLMCTSASPLHRPRMQQVVNMLLAIRRPHNNKNKNNNDNNKPLISKLVHSPPPHSHFSLSHPPF